MKRSIAPDRAGPLQPRDISVEISPWNREEERADENSSSRDGEMDWRIDIQKMQQGMGGRTKRLIQT
ncbi:MAG: hypothetical protein EZS28_044687 [Streblomastix strix]|uniref:Uncharacterized protein n=1 Tax=Streblomastix strix TaxID=222440 RepID=A0A5J4TMN6_9EUKA|nr:MAG: hypothetical protein EZS28_044687 [Streblomastix strix]